MTFAQKINTLSNEEKIDFIRFLMHKDKKMQVQMNLMAIVCLGCVILTIFK